MLVKTEVLQSKTNVKVLDKTLKRLQVKEKSINFAAESNNGCEVREHDWQKLEIINI